MIEVGDLYYRGGWLEFRLVICVRDDTVTFYENHVNEYVVNKLNTFDRKRFEFSCLNSVVYTIK